MLKLLLVPMLLVIVLYAAIELVAETKDKAKLFKKLVYFSGLLIVAIVILSIIVILF